MSSISKNNNSSNLPSFANVVFPDSYPYVISSSLNNNSFIVVNTNSEATILLPTNPFQGQSFRIKDGNGLSSSNPITIDGNGNNIDDQNIYIIAFSWGFVGVLFNGLQWNVSNN